MAVKRFFLVTVGIAILFSERAHADEIITLDQIRPLVEWVESRTNLMLLPRPRMYVSNTALIKLTGDQTESEHERIAAYRKGVIFISARFWQPGNVADESVVVHELVHYAQDVSGSRYACANQREAEAYQLQNLYLLEHGERPFMVHDDITNLGRCD